MEAHETVTGITSDPLVKEILRVGTFPSHLPGTLVLKRTLAAKDTAGPGCTAEVFAASLHVDTRT